MQYDWYGRHELNNPRLSRAFPGPLHRRRFRRTASIRRALKRPRYSISPSHQQRYRECRIAPAFDTAPYRFLRCYFRIDGHAQMHSDYICSRKEEKRSYVYAWSMFCTYRQTRTFFTHVLFIFHVQLQSHIIFRAHISYFFVVAKKLAKISLLFFRTNISRAPILHACMKNIFSKHITFFFTDSLITFTFYIGIAFAHQIGFLSAVAAVAWPESVFL